MTILKKIAFCLLIGAVCVGFVYLNLMVRRGIIALGEEPYPTADIQRIEKHKRDKLALSHAGDGGVIVCGDSLMGFWLRESPASWEYFMKPLGCMNVATGGDTVGHLRWRIRDGLFEHAKPSVVVICIGTNNISMDTPPWLVMWGLKNLVAEMRKIYDESVSFVLIPPFGGEEGSPMFDFRESMLHADWGKNIIVYPLFKELQEGGQVGGDGKYLLDGVHLSALGYERIAAPLARLIAGMKQPAR